MKTFLILISSLIPITLSGCGRKMPPKPVEGVKVTYPGSYPKPNCETAEKGKKEPTRRFLKKTNPEKISKN